jgi:hypothetical protein
VLAGFGYTALAAGRTPRLRIGIVSALALAMLVEYRATVGLMAYSPAAPAVYRLLASQPRGVVAEFPVPALDRLPGRDPEYAFMSTFHWFPLVNGYSGNYPPSYLARLARLRNFPDETALIQLRRDDVRYVIVHRLGHTDEAWADIRLKLNAAGSFVELGSFDSADGQALLYQAR